MWRNQIVLSVRYLSSSPKIPAYQTKIGETDDTKKMRLLYQSRKRGMLENGLLLSSFAAEYLKKMSATELNDYDKLINIPSNDWDIYYWATGVKPVPPEFDNDMMASLKEFAKNKTKCVRTVQPELY